MKEEEENFLKICVAYDMIKCHNFRHPDVDTAFKIISTEDPDKTPLWKKTYWIREIVENDKEYEKKRQQLETKIQFYQDKQFFESYRHLFPDQEILEEIENNPDFSWENSKYADELNEIEKQIHDWIQSLNSATTPVEIFPSINELNEKKNNDN